MRAMTSASHAWGSLSLSLAVYAVRRTMPSGRVFPNFHSELMIGVYDRMSFSRDPIILLSAQPRHEIFTQSTINDGPAPEDEG